MRGRSPAQCPPGPPGTAQEAAQSSLTPAEHVVSGDAAGCVSCSQTKRMSQGPALS